MSVSTKMAKKTDKVFSLGEKIQNGQEPNMSVNGKKQKLMVTELIRGQMVQSM